MGDSDHLGQVISKLAWTSSYKPGTIKAMCFRGFSAAGFLQDLSDARVCQQVLGEDNLEVADEVLHRELTYAANKWAPLKVMQLRKSLGPPLSPETIRLFKNRDDLTRRLKLGGTQEDLDQLKALSKAIKYKVRKDKREAWKGELDIDSTPRNAWKVARKALGIQSSTTPKSLVNGQGETVSNPLLIAEVLANHFSSKVNTLRQARRTVPVQDPRDRLRQYLKERFPGSE